MEIEERSFQIISDELGNRAVRFQGAELDIVKRAIHTTADFEYADLLAFSPDAVQSGLAALGRGCALYADTRMILAGIHARSCEKLGVRVFNHVADPEVAQAARAGGTTRSAVAMQKALNNPDIRIFAIGNAPTALMELVGAIQAGRVRPDLVVGVPVGFVGAEESKNLLMRQNIPYISVRGRKGGSTVAVAILNALLYRLDHER